MISIQRSSSNINNSNNNWAYGPDGWRNSPWLYGGPGGGGNAGYPPLNAIGPGGTIEEVEEGRTAPPAPALTPAAIITSDAPPPQHHHSHYHLGGGGGGGGSCGTHRHGRRRNRRGARYEEDYRYRDRDREQQRRDGFLGLTDREGDRVMERNDVVSQEAMMNAREGRALALLDRELDRRRGWGPGEGAGGRKGGDGGDGNDDDDNDESEGGEGKERRGGLRREIEALRKDLSRLVTGREGKAAKKAKGRRADGSGSRADRARGRGAASRSPRGRTSAAVGNNNITFGGRADTDDEDSQGDEDEERDDGHGSDDDEGLPPDWVRASEQGAAL